MTMMTNVREKFINKQTTNKLVGVFEKPSKTM